ncbi:TMEM175 family protein [Echinicola sediminis]
MSSGRLEAFSDGVLAIVITIMVLEMKVPEGGSWGDLKTVLPKFISYILSFLYLGLYWNNHHHLFQAVEKVNGKVLWANLFLLFTLSLIPFSTGWMGENHFSSKPVALYGVNLLACALAFLLLEYTLIKFEGRKSKVGMALQSNVKEYASLVLYISGLLLAFAYPIIGVLSYFAVAIIWLIPDMRIEKVLEQKQ